MTNQPPQDSSTSLHLSNGLLIENSVLNLDNELYSLDLQETLEVELQYVDLKNFGARDNAFRLRYFRQFSDLVSQRLPEIRKAHEANDREQLWRNLHGARPQLLFFGIQKVKDPMEQIEMGYARMDQAEIDDRINLIVHQMEGALKEIQALTAKIEMEGT